MKLLRQKTKDWAFAAGCGLIAVCMAGTVAFTAESAYRAQEVVTQHTTEIHRISVVQKAQTEESKTLARYAKQLAELVIQEDKELTAICEATPGCSL